MSHANERLKERAGFEESQCYQEIVSTALEYGQEVMYNKRGTIYKVRFKNRTIYPVIADDGTLVTVLAENMVRKDLHDEKYGKKRR